MKRQQALFLMGNMWDLISQETDEVCNGMTFEEIKSFHIQQQTDGKVENDCWACKEMDEREGKTFCERDCMIPWKKYDESVDECVSGKSPFLLAYQAYLKKDFEEFRKNAEIMADLAWYQLEIEVGEINEDYDFNQWRKDRSELSDVQGEGDSSQ